MRLRPSVLSSLAAAAAGVVVALALAGPGDASPPSTAAFVASDYHWQLAGDTATTVTIAAGGTVDFSYPTGVDAHNADFAGGPAPSSCTQTAGADGGAGVQPLPPAPAAHGWAGSCTFDAPGTYRFICDLHPTMHGTITVAAAAPATTTVARTTPVPVKTTTTTQVRPKPTAAPPSVRLDRSQRGGRVRGTVRLHAAATSLTVSLRATRAALGHRGRSGSVRVGRLTRGALRTGSHAFSVALDHTATAALRRRHRLVLGAVVHVVSPDLPAVTRTATVTLRRR